MSSFGKQEYLSLSFAGVVSLAVAFSSAAETSRVAGRWENHASSVYNGLSLSLNRRLSNEISFSGSCTFSKAIDDASDFSEQPQNPYSLHAERGLSANDQQHRLVFGGTFDLLFGDEEDGKKSSGVIDMLFGNVEAAPILTIGAVGRSIL
jgi:hypothetical protein